MTNLRSIRATLNYSVDNGARSDGCCYEPEAGVQLNLPGTATHEVEIRDGWPMAERCSAERCSAEHEGFEIHDFGARFGRFEDDASITSRREGIEVRTTAFS